MTIEYLFYIVILIAIFVGMYKWNLGSKFVKICKGILDSF